MIRLSYFASLVVLAGLSAPAMAEDGEGNCSSALRLSDSINPALATVSDPAPQTRFVKNRSDSKACPAAGVACTTRAYLVPNDEVFIGATFGDFVCATKLGAKGRATSGWLPKASVTAKTAAPVALADWLGTWTAPEQTIVIKRGRKAGAVALDANATFGALDPERVKRGAVNMGDFKAERAPEGGFLEFTLGPKGAIPFSQGESSDCRVQLLRLGPHLIVEDNGNCGGMNVSFTGVYRLKK